MVQMEVDLHAPAFMALRPRTKRARSPASSIDYPNKRLSLSMDRFKNSHSNGNATPQSSACSSRFPSEDWVHQADGLTIDSPSVSGFGLEEADEDVNMDSDEVDNMVQTNPSPPVQRPNLPPIQTTQMNFAHAALFRQNQNTPHSATSSVPTPPGPLVTILPPTPSSTSSSAPPVYIDKPDPDMRASMPMDTTSTTNTMPSSSPLVSFTSPKKQRFTMGPRADCIKCQMNVKGHSVHY